MTGAPIDLNGGKKSSKKTTDLNSWLNDFTGGSIDS